MQNNELREVVKRADDAINAEDFDSVMDFYSDDAVLVVKPGLLAKGKPQIRRAFEAIADYFNHSLHVNQDKLSILESGDTALVIAKAMINSKNKTDSEFSTERIATYVFRRDPQGNWKCVIDNSYGAELLDSEDIQKGE
ncbi:MAG TPA: SgcJ/EcaC family oxidoreductase [Spirochaetota bacterium]